MAEWVHVENNEIKEYHDQLPKSWKHISGLDKADDSFLLSQGWYRVVKNYASFDTNTHEVIGYQYEVLSDRVVETLRLRAFTQEDINNRNREKRDNFYSALRAERNRLLQESDWTQVVDLQALKSQQWIDSWRTYRQSLRDLPAQYENIENYDSVSISWPTEPGF